MISYRTNFENKEQEGKIPAIFCRTITALLHFQEVVDEIFNTLTAELLELFSAVVIIDITKGTFTNCIVALVFDVPTEIATNVRYARSIQHLQSRKDQPTETCHL